jgi:hypothetical protein
MKKTIIFIMTMIVMISLIGCNDSNDSETTTEQTTEFVDNLSDTYDFIDKVEFDGQLSGYFLEEDFLKVLYIADDILIYTVDNNSVVDNLIEVDTEVKVVTLDGVETYSIGLHQIDTFLGYDSVNKVIYYSDSRIIYTAGLGDKSIDYVVPVSSATLDFVVSSAGIYNYQSEKINSDDYNSLAFFKYYDKDDEIIYYSYNNSQVSNGYCQIERFSATDNTSLGVVEVANDIECKDVVYYDSDSIVISLKYEDGYISLDKEGNISYFIQDNNNPEGFYPNLENGIARYQYPYFGYTNDSSEKKYVVANDKLSTFVEVDNYNSVIYIDDDIYVIRDGEDYLFYQEGINTYTYSSTAAYVSVSFSRLDNYLIIKDYYSSTIYIYDMIQHVSFKSIAGEMYLDLKDAFIFVNPNEIGKYYLYNLNDFTTITIESSFKLFYLNEDYFILYNDESIVMYEVDTLNQITFDNISTLTREGDFGQAIVYGFIGMYENQYYKIG